MLVPRKSGPHLQVKPLLLLRFTTAVTLADLVAVDGTEYAVTHCTRNQSGRVLLVHVLLEDVAQPKSNLAPECIARTLQKICCDAFSTRGITKLCRRRVLGGVGELGSVRAQAGTVPMRFWLGPCKPTGDGESD